MTLKIRGLKIGEGRPKIIAPIVGRTRGEILAQAAAMRSSPVDLVEWRADEYEGADDAGRLLQMFIVLRGQLGRDMPLLFTYRTQEEGGRGKSNLYRRVCLSAIESGHADIIDVEIDQGEEMIWDLRRAIHGAGAHLLLSHHDFHSTPEEEQIIETLARMGAYGADIRKVAYMPNNMADVRMLLQACAKATDMRVGPILAISMGKLGVISRIACETYGMSLTFGDAVGASAPGQIPVEALRSILNLLHIK